MTPEAAKKLREPFPKTAIGKLPKGGVQLDYVGHAAVTDRLLAVDPQWTWEPLALSPEGLPALDRAGNLWIRMTVCGVTRIGVGDGKSAKECISDAIRNAAMRFGVALDLWSKEEIGPSDAGQTPPARQEAPAPAPPAAPSAEDLAALYKLVEAKGGDVKKTMTSAETATEAGKLEVWYDGALQYWSKQADSFANKVPAKAKAAA